MGVGTVLIALLTGVVGLAGPAARIVDEWRPGVAESNLGGDLTVDGYGVSGLGFYAVQFDDGASALAVCVQADVGHSASAEYVAEAPTTITPELDYLLWRYASPERPAATNEQAAAINVLSWWYAGAQRRGGGPVWHDPAGRTVELDVAGVGRLHAVESAVVALRDEANHQRSPWALSDLAFVDSVARVRLTGPGGPIAAATVTFVSGGEPHLAVTDGDGWASAAVAAVDVLVARAEAPGPTIALTAPGSQRLVIAGPPVIIETSIVVPPPPTTTTTTSTSTTTTTTTSTTTSTSTTTTTTTIAAPIASTTTAATTAASTSTPVPPPTATVPATLPRSGDGSRSWTRLGAVAFAAGAMLLLLAASTQPGRWCAARRRCTSASEVAEKS